MYAPTFHVIRKRISAKLVVRIVTSIGALKKRIGDWPMKISMLRKGDTTTIAKLRARAAKVIIFGLGVPVSGSVNEQLFPYQRPFCASARCSFFNFRFGKGERYYM